MSSTNPIFWHTNALKVGEAGLSSPNILKPSHNGAGYGGGWSASCIFTLKNPHEDCVNDFRYLGYEALSTAAPAGRQARKQKSQHSGRSCRTVILAGQDGATDCVLALAWDGSVSPHGVVFRPDCPLEPP